MPQIRKGLICLGVIFVGAIVFFALLTRQKAGSNPGAPSLPEPKKQDVPIFRMTFDPPTRQPSEQRLASGVLHIYQLPMEEGDLLELIVEQKGVDLQVEVLDPTGEPLFTVDSPNGKDGPERVLLVASESAPYRAQISSWGQRETGKYQIWIEAQRRATPEEVKEARAEELFHQAKEMEEPGAFRSRESKLHEAARLWEQTGNHARQAVALGLLGELYAQEEHHWESLRVRQQAKSLYRRSGRFGDEGILANDIGTSHVDLSQLDLAQKSYSEALALGERAGHHHVTATALFGLGFVSWQQGRSAEALDRLEQSRIASKGLDSVLEGKALMALGGVYSDAGNTELAISNFEKALVIFEKSDRQKAIALAQMGNAYIRSRDPEQAQSLYQKALEIQERIGDERNMRVTLNGIGLAHLNQKQHQEALDSFLQSLRLAQRNPLHEARIWTNLGWTYSELRQEDEAYSAYAKALRLGQKTQDRWMETAALLGLALLEETRRNPIAAQLQAEAAIRSVEELRAETRSDINIAFMASQQDVYDTLIDILLWRHELSPSAGFDAQALRVSEQARSRGLLDKILERFPAGRADEIPQELRILSLKEIQRTVLDPDTLLLEYHLGRDASYLWLVEGSYSKLFKLPPREELERLAEKTRLLMSNSNRREKSREARKAAMELARNLTNPVIGFLGKKRLLISAPGALQAVPFHALPDLAALEPESEWDWPRPLMVNHEVIKIPSASVLAALQARGDERTPPQELLAILADGVFGFDDERLAGVGKPVEEARSKMPRELFLGPLKRLRHARDEAESILREVGLRGTYSAVGFDARRDLVHSGKLSNFRNVHLATHGVLLGDEDDLSALVFSLVDPKGRSLEGLLPATEVYGFNLPADLVTLSACETGLGERIPGEGLMGLPHAFFAAGATRVVVSLWKVNDRATAKLMKRFYNEYLTQGHSPAAALREAQIAMWQDPKYRAPFYWGGFELQGDWRAVESSR